MRLLKEAGRSQNAMREQILRSMAEQAGIMVGPAVLATAQAPAAEWKTIDVAKMFRVSSATVNNTADGIGLTPGDGYRTYTSQHAWGENARARMYDESGLERMRPHLERKQEKAEARAAKSVAASIN
jgi:hypothetical protein